MPIYEKRSACWTRMAQAYVIMGEKNEACQLLVHASEIEPLLWEIWRDLALLSVDCKNYDKTIQSYLRILEIGENYLNVDLLDKIAYGISGENAVSPSSEMRSKLMELFTKLIQRFPNYPPLWCAYGLTIASVENPSKKIREDAITALQNSLKILIDDKYWYLKVNKIGHIIDSAYHIIRAFIAVSDKFYGTPESTKLLENARAVTNNLTSKLEEAQLDIISGLVISRFSHTYNSLKTLLVTIDKKLFYKDFYKVDSTSV
ncbi:uncharacterized protein LOC112126154 [Cimex lectularius]|uniref:Uncharacterized protein n=1 Tax=Cimex lectularius TaxID=79782 RepID=A0A8I6SAW8_CIMLE|nr:uncharacterized protein LOC112126154 [Cimex lectularius]